MRFLLSIALTVTLVLSGCSSGPATRQVDHAGYKEPLYSAERILPGEVMDPALTYDPWQGLNKRIYNFNYHFDRKVFLPVVRGWEAVVPGFARQGIHNFFNNFRDVRTLVNAILQLSPEKTAQATGRVLINSTVGLLGLIDVATSMEFQRPVEDFGQTLGYWGLGPGPYLVIPFLGPSSLRDGVGLLADTMVTTEVQNEVLSKPLRNSAFLLDAVDTRANVPFRYYETGSVFEYDTLRWLYTVKRELDIAK